MEDEAVVDEMFVSLSECAALHPCDDDENEEDFSDFSDSEEPPNKLGKVDPRFEDAAENWMFLLFINHTHNLSLILFCFDNKLLN